jgi:hypothetical protein
MILRSLPVLAASLVLAAPAAAQSDAGEARKDVAAGAVPIKIPQGSLGEMFRDAPFDFEFRVPARMRPVAADRLEQLRAQMIPAELRHRAEDGTERRVVELFQFDDGVTGVLRIRIHRPPVLTIDSPSSLRFAVNEPDRLKGLPLENIGDPGQFLTRDGRNAYFVERELGIDPAGPRTHKQGTAFLRSKDRSFLVDYTDTIAAYDAGRDDFLAALGTFAIREGRTVAIEDLVPARAPEKMSTATIANLALAVVGLVGLVFVLRQSRRRGENTAQSGSPAAP